MKRLLMITGKGGGSLAQGHRGAFYNTLEALHTQWDQIDVITPTIGHHVTQVFFGNVYVHTSPWPLVLQPLFILKKGMQLFKHRPFDIMTVHEYPPFYNGIGAWLLHRSIRVPYLLEIMHIPGLPKAGSFMEFVYRWLMRVFIRFDARAAKAIRVINRHQTPDFLRASGVPAEKLRYIPAFYIDLETFHPQEAEKKCDCLFAGRLVSNKGVFLFLDAVKKMRTASACIVGEGPARKDIEKYIEQHDLASRVHVHGWAADSREMALLMNESRTLIMPSYNEGGPRVVLEAMACGVPVIATPVGIVPDIIHDRESGRIVSWNADEIAKTVAETLQDADARERYRRQGIVIAGQFERHKNIAQVTKALESLIES